MRSESGLRYIVRTGAHWRMLPHDVPPWPVVSQQTRRWRAAGGFETLVENLRVLVRLTAKRRGQPTAAILDRRTLHSTPERGARAGYDGRKRRKRRKGAKGHLAVDPLGNLLTLLVTPANEPTNEPDRAQVAALATQMQEVTGERVELAYVAQGYTGEQLAAAAAQHGMPLAVVKLPEAVGPKRGFVLGPRRWVVERNFAWSTRFRRLVRDAERLPPVLAGLHFVHFVVFACLMRGQLLHFISSP